MSDCPHHPSLKRRSPTFSAEVIPSKVDGAVLTYMLHPADCVQCAMTRIEALRPALLDAALLAGQLMRHPSPVSPQEATKRLTAIFETYFADVRNWYDP